MGNTYHRLETEIPVEGEQIPDRVYGGTHIRGAWPGICVRGNTYNRGTYILATAVDGRF